MITFPSLSTLRDGRYSYDHFILGKFNIMTHVAECLHSATPEKKGECLQHFRIPTSSLSFSPPHCRGSCSHFSCPECPMSKTTLLLLPSPTHPNPIPLGSLPALRPSLHLTPASLMRCVRSAIIRVVFPPRQILCSFGYNEIKFQGTKSEKFFKEALQTRFLHATSRML